MNAADLRTELEQTYTDYYMRGFRDNDVALIDEIVDYPICYLKNGRVEMLDHFPVDPAVLKAEKQWDHSIDWTFDIPAITEAYAHVTASATRCRADGSIIEKVHAFYDFKRMQGVWRMYALAELVC